MSRVGRVRVPDEAPADLLDGFDTIREDFDVPGEFPPVVRRAAEDAAARPIDVVDPGSTRSTWQHVDRTGIEFVTLDPSSSTDLDQAFVVERAGSDIVLRYAIADVGWFVRHGDPIDEEAWQRGVTVYMPDARAGLHPPRLAEDAASLLPSGPRPAVVFAVRVDEAGRVSLDGVERALVRSRAKLAYATVGADDLGPGFFELARRIEAAELERGADRIEWPEQEVVPRRGGFELRFRPRSDAERQNAALSLATNLAVADALFQAGTGLFRTMPPVDERRIGQLRHSAHAFGLEWPREMSLADFERSLPTGDPATAAFQLAVRRASGGASYTPYSAIASGEGLDEGALVDGRPWHAAVAATYAHATAPLRRLADRYVIEAVLAVANGRDVPAEVETAFADLPEAMRRGDSRANRVDRAAVDLVEAIVLRDRVGETFQAVVTDEDERGVRIQLREPAVVDRTIARRVDPGDEITVRLVATDPVRRTVDFERVG